MQLNLLQSQHLVEARDFMIKIKKYLLPNLWKPNHQLRLFQMFPVIDSAFVIRHGGGSPRSIEYWFPNFCCRDALTNVLKIAARFCIKLNQRLQTIFLLDDSFLQEQACKKLLTWFLSHLFIENSTRRKDLSPLSRDFLMFISLIYLIKFQLHYI